MTQQTQALAGLRVIDFSDTRAGTQTSQLFADFGAEVILVERPGGSALRRDGAWPFWGRGKQSIELDLKAPDDLQVAQRLAGSADVVIESFRPGVADRLGIGYATLAAGNPGLVYASISGFGQSGPLAGLQGYEGIVMATFGAMSALSTLSPGDGPGFASAAYCAFATSQLAAQGILAALYERGKSGAGQRVETSLAEGLTVYDTFNWFSRVVASRFQDSFTQTPVSANGVPSGGLSFRLLIALTKDGRWLQFSQTVDRLFRAMMAMFGLTWMFDDPRWKTAPDFDDVDTRREFWEILLAKVREKTVAEWAAEFDRDPNVWGELFRKGSELLDHPQMMWNGMTHETADRDVGALRMPGPMIRADATPARIGVAPRLGEHAAALRRIAEALSDPAPGGTAPPAVRAKPPLDGVTVIELGTYYAAPYGATLLAELGARVIKLEQPDGDPHRNMLPFPEVSGMKVLQGKDCVAIDLHGDAGRAVAHAIIAKADIVLQSFRAGVAERLGLDAATLHAINPGLIYQSAPGYGESGPCGHRPAFAPTIGAAAGLAWRNGESVIPEGPDLSPAETKAAALRLAAAVMGVGNADGLSAASVATSMLLGLVARQRGAGGQVLFTSMLSSAAHALAETMVEYDGVAPPDRADAIVQGFHALYHLYKAADGRWLFLAAPRQREWERLCGALPGGTALRDDARFATMASRRDHDAALLDALAETFATQPAAAWEALLRAADVACVVCAPGPVEANYLDAGSVGQQLGLVTETDNPFLDRVPRLKALMRFSRSETVAGPAGLVGQDTDRVLADFGYDAAEIAQLGERHVVVQN
ncbi:CaiB/BaiF CoA transferase family protein [Sphingomonas immobilis]|uniref:CoA transferase n=1 Tax=Sphingomonas immobilis TaxID=3063997 RepID=A0ABT8ZXG1_9SPHN|nr:CoA transferase [Sphingomonas sp. CA1-15]MDO7842260.1 CoA transferase [Sphingomonas sp. CA1-15]